MVHAAEAEHRGRRRAVAAALLGLQLLSFRLGYGLPAFLVLAIVTIYFFGTRNKWDGEVSAYSVFNSDGRRLPGQLTTEHIEAQLRGHTVHDRVNDEGSSLRDQHAGHRLGSADVSATATLPPAEDRELRRRLLATAAESRLQRVVSDDENRRDSPLATTTVASSR